MAKIFEYFKESLEERLLWDWMILRKQADDILSEVAHVFTNHEADVATHDLLIVDSLIAKL